MIALAKSIAHTRASISYGWNQEKDAVVVYKEYLAGNTPQELTKEFEIIQGMNEKCKKNTLGFVLSPTIEDGKKLRKKDLGEITRKFLIEMKLTERQAIAFVHTDKAHVHIHLYVNRIDFQGKAYDDSFIGKKSSRAAEKVARQMNLKTVRQVQTEKLNSLKPIRKEIHLMHHKVIADKKVRTLDDYIKAMGRQNIKVLPSINKGGKLQGFRFEYKGANLKASEVSRSLGGSRILEDINRSNTITVVKPPITETHLGNNTLKPLPFLSDGIYEEPEQEDETNNKKLKNGKNRRTGRAFGR
ncbi:relaxase/mobilization nuclease domain-containing protein [Maribacter luteus]|uniref:relaxase/mobilization nuclease domain-containing protein n=1 Tax=Maribacter luteus TaxID=2594478 RepID=UPI002492F128|nr:relaxase/mobilization nuclease domain-containing protein [Maribacter luteus]